MKRTLASILAVCMLLMMLPAMSVSAASISWPAIGGNVTIGGQTFEYIGEMGEHFGYIGLTEDDDVGTPYAGKFGAGYFTWDGEDTLVLNNTTGNFVDRYSIVSIDELTVNIVLKGKNVWNVSNMTEFEGGNYESLYAFDLYEKYDGETGTSLNSYTISGGGSIELNATSGSFAQVIWTSAPLYIEGVTIDATLKAPEVRGIGYNYQEISNSNISINGSVYDAEYYSIALYTYSDMLIQNSRITGKIAALSTSDVAEEIPYMEFIDADGTITINNSIVSGEVTSQGWAYALFADGEIYIENNSAVEVKCNGDDCHVIEAHTTYIDNSYVYATANNGAAIVTYDTEDGNVWVNNATVLTPKSPYGITYTAADEMDYIAVGSDAGIAKKVMIAPRAYSDVAANQWFAPAVGFATARGLFQGVDANRFAPDNKFTRAQMMTVLARMDGANVTPAAGEVWYKKAVDWAKANGVSDGSNPDGQITREQMITMVWRFLGEPEGNGNLNVFTDKGKIDSWAKEALEWAVEYKVISGRGAGILDPDGNATRAEAAQLLKNFLINY